MKVAVSLFFGAALCSSAHAYKTSLTKTSFGTSLGGVYAGQISSIVENGWDLAKAVTPSGSNYTLIKNYQTPLRLGFFYRSPNFTIEPYLKYFTNFQNSWSLSGTTSGTGSTKFEGNVLGLDFEMPIATRDRFRFGFMINAEYLLNKAKHVFEPTSGAKQTLVAGSNHSLWSGGFFTEAYLGDLWALSLRGLYSYDLGSTWKAKKAGSLFGTSYVAGGDILGSDGNPLATNLSHWRVEVLLRLSFY